MYTRPLACRVCSTRLGGELDYREVAPSGGAYAIADPSHLTEGYVAMLSRLRDTG